MKFLVFLNQVHSLLIHQLIRSTQRLQKIAGQISNRFLRKNDMTGSKQMNRSEQENELQKAQRNHPFWSRNREQKQAM